MKQKNNMFILVGFLLSISSFTVAATPEAPKTVNNSWYTMQAGSTPWGYFHETIEKYSEHYSYKYQMKKFEAGKVSEENIGAMCRLDLTPMSLNIFKQSGNTTESVDATYNEDKKAPTMTVKISGANNATHNRLLEKADLSSAECKKNPSQCKSTILDVFYPVYLSLNWSKLKTGYKDWLSIFTEDPENHDFFTRKIYLEVKDYSTKSKCLNIITKMEPRNDIIRWCTTKEGVMVEMDGPGFKVRKVANEKEALGFVSGLKK